MPQWIAKTCDWLSQPLLRLGREGYSALTLLKFVAFVALLLAGASLLRKVLRKRVFPRLRIEAGAGYALAELSRYAVILLGLIVGLQTAGVELSTVTVLFGALGVGIGFGLQTIASNFVSGLIILIERPLQVGDRIQVGDLHGRVVRIRFRATEVHTNDGIAVIVPNSEFIAQRVVNWSRGGDWIRIRVPVGVAYGSDVTKVREALLEAAAQVDAALKSPAPEVRLRRFGESSLDFELLAWTSQMLHNRGAFVSRLNLAVHAALQKHGLEVPFPQRDVHLRTAIPLSVPWAPPGEPGGASRQPADTCP